MNFHESIDDLPIYNWFKIHESSDYTFILLKKKKVTDKEKKALISIWNKIYNEYILKFGFSDEYLHVIEKRKHIALLQIDMIESGDASLQTIIEINESELERRKAALPKNDFYAIKAVIEKKMGFKIDIKTCSVVEFFTYLKNIEKQN